MHFANLPLPQWKVVSPLSSHTQWIPLEDWEKSPLGYALEMMHSRLKKKQTNSILCVIQHLFIWYFSFHWHGKVDKLLPSNLHDLIPRIRPNWSVLLWPLNEKIQFITAIKVMQFQAKQFACIITHWYCSEATETHICKLSMGLEKPKLDKVMSMLFNNNYYWLLFSFCLSSYGCT